MKKIPDILLGIDNKGEVIYMEKSKEDKLIMVGNGRSGMGMSMLSNNIKNYFFRKGYKIINFNDRQKGD